MLAAPEYAKYAIKQLGMHTLTIHTSYDLKLRNKHGKTGAGTRYTISARLLQNEDDSEIKMEEQLETK